LPIQDRVYLQLGILKLNAQTLRLGKLKFPYLSVYRNGGFLIPYQLPGNQPGAIGLPNKPIAHNFSVVSTEKSHSNM
jgi:hypothetical protein